MAKKIVLVTGGQRSGKSDYAQQLALQLSERPVYLATSRIWDEEFRRRIERHQRQRGPQWTNIEEEKFLSRHLLENRTIVIDCLTLWTTNFFFDNDSDIKKSLLHLKMRRRENFIQFMPDNRSRSPVHPEGRPVHSDNIRQ